MNQRVFGCFLAGAMTLAASPAHAIPVVPGGTGWPTPVRLADAPAVAAGTAANGGLDAQVAPIPTSLGANAVDSRFGAASTGIASGDPGAVVPSFSPTALAAAVPESASWTMLFVGVGMMGFALRRRRSARAGVRFA